MILVADTSPLIFLGKLRKLNWIELLFQGTFYLPSLVRDELLAKEIPAAEEEYFLHELRNWQIVSWQPRALRAGSGLSPSDLAVLAVAEQVKANWILADEKALRNILLTRRHGVLGTLGVLVLAARQKLATSTEIKTLAEQLITAHQFRISAATYQAFLKSLD